MSAGRRAFQPGSRSTKCAFRPTPAFSTTSFAVFDPLIAMDPQAPILHDKGTEAKGNIYAEIHGEVGCVEDGFTVADAIHEMT
jgi:hypothetical protein